MESNNGEFAEDGLLKSMPKGLDTCLLLHTIYSAFIALPLLVTPRKVLEYEEEDLLTETVCRILGFACFLVVIISLKARERRPHIAIDSLYYLFWWNILMFFGFGFAIFEGAHPEWWWSHLLLMATNLVFAIIWILSHSHFETMVKRKMEKDGNSSIMMA